MLDADTVEWFAENGGLRRENGDLFRRELLSRGGSVDPMQAYRAFRGRDPEIGPLLATGDAASPGRPTAARAVGSAGRCDPSAAAGSVLR